MAAKKKSKRISPVDAAKRQFKRKAIKLITEIVDSFKTYEYTGQFSVANIPELVGRRQGLQEAISIIKSL